MEHKKKNNKAAALIFRGMIAAVTQSWDVKEKKIWIQTWLWNERDDWCLTVTCPMFYAGGEMTATLSVNLKKMARNIVMDAGNS